MTQKQNTWNIKTLEQLEKDFFIDVKKSKNILKEYETQMGF